MNQEPSRYLNLAFGLNPMTSPMTLEMSDDKPFAIAMTTGYAHYRLGRI